MGELKGISFGRSRRYILRVNARACLLTPQMFLEDTLSLSLFLLSECMEASFTKTSSRPPT